MSDAAKRLLIVEDETDLREVLVDIFGRLTAEVSQAPDGREALRLVREVRPHAIVTDIKMPAMSGLAFVAELRRQGLQTPCVFISAYGDKANVLEALRLGAFDFIDKPFDALQIIEVVGNALELGFEIEKNEKKMDIELNHSSVNPVDPGGIEDRFINIHRAVARLKVERDFYSKRKI